MNCPLCGKETKDGYCADCGFRTTPEQNKIDANGLETGTSDGFAAPNAYSTPQGGYSSSAESGGQVNNGNAPNAYSTPNGYSAPVGEGEQVANNGNAPNAYSTPNGYSTPVGEGEQVANNGNAPNAYSTPQGGAEQPVSGYSAPNPYGAPQGAGYSAPVGGAVPPYTMPPVGGQSLPPGYGMTPMGTPTKKGNNKVVAIVLVSALIVIPIILVVLGVFLFNNFSSTSLPDYYDNEAMVKEVEELTDEEIAEYGKYASQLKVQVFEKESYFNEIEVLFVVDNPTDKNLETRLVVAAYNAEGELINAAEQTKYSFGAGTQTIFTLYFNQEVDNYEYNLVTRPSTYPDASLHDLEYDIKSRNNVHEVTITNNGRKTFQYVRGHMILVKDGEMVGYKVWYFSDSDTKLKPGGTTSANYEFYDEPEYDDIIFVVEGDLT